MKKFICTVLALLVLCLAACTPAETPNKGENNPYYDAQTDAILIGDLKSDMIKELDISDALDLDVDALLNQYGIQEADVADLACFITLDGVFPQEIIMVRAADQEAAGRIKEHLQTRLAEFRVQSKDYDAESYAIAQKCDILTSGVYIAMFLSPDYQQLAEMFQNAMKL